MKAKKISAKDFNYIWEPSETYREKDWMKTYIMKKSDNNSYYVHESMKKWLFILLFIPVSIDAFFRCLWDGGLKEFGFPPYFKHDWELDISNKEYIEEYFKRADEVWYRKT